VATEARPRAGKPADPDEQRLCLWLRDEAGRRGVPLLRSFEQWIGAIPELQAADRWTEINILITGVEDGCRYNREFRGRDYATNVLSFPYEPAPGEHPGLLGDIVICAPVVLREASEQGKPARDHFAHLAIHGVLHLLGYDHETEADAERMEGIEREVLDSLGIGDPYRQAQITPPRSGPAPR
jgi:probable rRNA maturation factor